MADNDLNKLTIDKQASAFAPGRRRRKRWLIIGLLVLLVAGAGIRWLLLSTVTVETGTVTLIYPSQTFTLLNASGYVVAQRKAAVAAKTTGQLEWLGVQEGSRVTAGQIIARLENRDVTASRNQAAAGLVTARANLEEAGAERLDAERSFKRIQELVASGIVAQSDYDTAEARLKRARAAEEGMASAINGARAALSGADAALDYTLIRAPFDAVVLTKNADVGDIITPIGAAANAKAAVVTIADLGSLQVEADVSESNLAKVKVGQPCEVQLDAFPDIRFRGVLQTIVPTADRSKASVMVKVRFVDRDARVLPEMSAKVAFLEREETLAEKRPKTAVIPAAVAERNGGKLLYVVKDGRVKGVPVTLGPRIGDLVEVTSGVKAGETVVTKPLDRLRDGMKVKLAEKG